MKVKWDKNIKAWIDFEVGKAIIPRPYIGGWCIFFHDMENLDADALYCSATKSWEFGWEYLSEYIDILQKIILEKIIPEGYEEAWNILSDLFKVGG